MHKKWQKASVEAQTHSTTPDAISTLPDAAADQTMPFILLDSKRMPFWLYLPNLIGYVRYLTLLLAMVEEDPAGDFAMKMLALSLFLDYLDGPAARRFDMCTQFGDLLDHFCDHITIMWCVHVTTASAVNWWVNLVTTAATLLYMVATGHYFKHNSTSNVVTATVEANNYFNMFSILWCANSMLVPLVKMSYHADKGLGPTEGTFFLDLVDTVGMVVCGVYTAACCAAAVDAKSKAK